MVAHLKRPRVSTGSLYPRTMSSLMLLLVLSPLFYGSVAKEINARIYSNQNNRPIFLDCSRYAPVITEGEPKNVIQVHAEDQDPPENGGTITYRFITDEKDRFSTTYKKFKINERTGLISSTARIDRDSSDGHRVVLNVCATDNGTPQLDGTCTFIVTIADINDHAPKFLSPVYRKSVPRSLMPGQEVIRIEAEDVDNGKNSIIHYSMTNRAEDADYFWIDRNTGTIFLKKAIDNKNPGYMFYLTVTATDQGDEKKSSVTTVEIYVGNFVNTVMTFSKSPNKPIQIKESEKNFDMVIADLEVKSYSQNILFDLTEFPDGTLQKTFRLEYNGTKAFIKLAKPLDYETKPNYTLIVRAMNEADQNAVATIYIEVLDVNDNIPEFREPQYCASQDSKPPGYVMQVCAIDNDGKDHNQVTYSLGTYTDLFTIDSRSGIITKKNGASFNESDYYVEVHATDNSPSALFTTNEHNSQVKMFYVKIA